MLLVPRFSLLSPTPDECKAGAALFTPAPCPTKEPICDGDDLGRLLPMMSLICMLDDVIEDATFIVELEFKKPSELLVGPIRPCDNACDFLNHITDLSVVFLAASLPSDNQPFVARIGNRTTSILDHALRKYLKPDISKYRHSPPRHRGGPESGCVRDLAANGGEMGMRRRKQVQGDAR